MDENEKGQGGGSAGMVQRALQKGNEDSLKARTPILPTKDGGWSQLAELVLEAEISDEVANLVAQEVARRKAGSIFEFDSPIGEVKVVTAAMSALALRLGTDLDELSAVKESIEAGVWEEKRWERATRREKIRTRLGAYEELASLAIDKLIERIQSGGIREASELIAVANLGERMSLMTQGKIAPGQATGVAPDQTVNLQINNISSALPNGDLPGPGMVGTIQLSLSNRVHRQLTEQPLVDQDIDSDERFLNQIDMLSAREIPDLLREKKDEESSTE